MPESLEHIQMGASYGGGFGLYSLINSAVMFASGIAQRGDKARQDEEAKKFKEQLDKAKEQFQDEKDAREYAFMRAKMQLGRELRLIEAHDRQELATKRPQVVKMLNEHLPLDPTLLEALMLKEEEYKEQVKKGGIAPLNILLLHAHTGVNPDKVDEATARMLSPLAGSVNVIEQWVHKDARGIATGNGALFNLNVIMGNLPMLVVSPRYVADDKRVEFSAAMWDAAADRHPLIRPLFSMDFDAALLRQPEGQKRLQNKLVFASTVIGGCARDAFMLMNYGLRPVFPTLVKHNKWLLGALKTPEGLAVRRFMLREYRTNLTALIGQAQQAEEERARLLLPLVREAYSALKTVILPYKNIQA